MKIKLKEKDQLIPYSSSCMGFDSIVRAKLNNGEIVDINTIPEKGMNYVEIVTSLKKRSKK